MKSKLTIDLDENNQPIIHIYYEETEDVRDKMVKRFLETFGGDSSWAEFTFEHNGSSATITPIKPYNLKITKENIETRIDKIK